MKRKLWAQTFQAENPPKFPCPHCSDGHLNLVPDSTKIIEPRYSEDAHAHVAWEPDWITERFNMTLRCDNQTCGEVAFVVGDTTISEQIEDGPDGWVQTFVTALRPKAIFPAPAMIELPEDMSLGIVAPLKDAFRLFWSDHGASAAKVRASLERVLDDKLVPTTTITKGGDVVNLDLNGRVQAFEKTNPDEAPTFHALRMVGNLGAHGQNVDREALLDVLEIYESALEDLYSNKKEKLKAIQEKILKRKGKY